MVDADNESAKPQSESPPQATATTQKSVAAPADIDDDSDPDFDDLDDVLDQFSANAPTQSKSVSNQPPENTPDVSGPGRPSTTTQVAASQDEYKGPAGPKADETESDFIERLSKEMSTMIDSIAGDPSRTAQSPEDYAKMGKELEDFTHKMEQQGIQPEDLLKALLGPEEGSKLADLAHAERDKRDRQDQQPEASSSTSQTTQPTATTSSSSNKPPPKSFEDTIRKTMSRLDNSDKSAKTAVQKSSQKSEEDLLADMLRALDSGPGGAASTGDDDGLSKMFMDMMQQLTHKDLLYEPMKELNDQYPAWLSSHKSKLSTSEYERFERQSVIVRDIARKFEEPGFSDDDPQCKEYIWEKMQRMQDEGAPPEELVKNPFPGSDLGGIPGLGGFGGGGGGGGGDGDAAMPEGLAKELEEGCPTQ